MCVSRILLLFSLNTPPSPAKNLSIVQKVFDCDLATFNNDKNTQYLKITFLAHFSMVHNKPYSI